MEYGLVALTCLFFACLLTGFSKSSIGGLGILTVPILVYGFGAKPALGIFLPILIFTDILSAWIYRGQCNWSALWQLLPTTIIGIVIGFFLINIIPDRLFILFIGVIIIAMLGLSFLSEYLPNLGKNKSYSSGLGVLVGLTSIIANSAGTLVGIYFLQHNLEKKTFVGTRCHFFLLLNSMKFPFIASLGLINAQTLLLDILFIPVIFFGSWLGVKFINKVDLHLLKRVVQTAAAISGIKMIYNGLQASFS